MPEKSLAVIGEEDVVMGFEALGFSIYAVNQAQEFKTVLDRAISQGAGICLVQDNFYIREREFINNYRNLVLPIIIPFAKDGSMNLLDSIIKDIRLKATGTF